MYVLQYSLFIDNALDKVRGHISGDVALKLLDFFERAQAAGDFVGGQRDQGGQLGHQLESFFSALQRSLVHHFAKGVEPVRRSSIGIVEQGVFFEVVARKVKYEKLEDVHLSIVIRSEKALQVLLIKELHVLVALNAQQRVGIVVDNARQKEVKSDGGQGKGNAGVEKVDHQWPIFETARKLLEHHSDNGVTASKAGKSQWVQIEGEDEIVGRPPLKVVDGVTKVEA